MDLWQLKWRTQTWRLLSWPALMFSHCPLSVLRPSLMAPPSLSLCPPYPEDPESRPHRSGRLLGTFLNLPPPLC